MAKISISELIKKLTEIAVEKGADPNLIKLIDAKDIVIPEWPRWKCQFGCTMYGRRLCCPPFVPDPDDTRKLLKNYDKALVIGFSGAHKSKTLQMLTWPKRIHKINKILLELEKESFKAGFEKAFVFFAGVCTFCKVCATKDLPENIDPKMAKRYCTHKDKMRPSSEAVGIDVFGTVRNAGLDIKVVTSKESKDVKSYAFLLIE